MSSYETLGFPHQPGIAPPDPDEDLETWPQENDETFEDEPKKPKATTRKPAKKA